MAFVPADVERRITGDVHKVEEAAEQGGELLVWIPEQLAPRMIRALESVADLVEQRHGSTPIVELTRHMASLVRGALAR